MEAPIIETDVTELEPLDLGKAKEWFLFLEKLLRSHRIYAQGHPSIAEFEKRLFQLSEEILENDYEFTFAVKPYDFEYLGDVVYHNDDKQENFSYKLHQDGIRQITLLRGLEIEELTQLAQILRTDFESYEFFDDDTVTLLWKAHFQQIHYVIVETFAECGLEADEVENALNDTRRGLFQDSSPTDLNQALAEGKRHLRKQDISDIVELPEISLDLFETSSGLQKGVLEEAAKDDELVVQKMLLILFQVLLGEVQEEKFNSIADVIKKLTKSMIRLGKFDLTAKVYGKVRQLRDPKVNPEKEGALLMSGLLEQLHDDDFLDSVTHALPNLNRENAPLFGEFLSKLNPTAAKKAFRWFTKDISPECRKPLIPGLAKLMSRSADLISSELRGSEAEMTFLLLDLLSEIGIEKTAPAIRRSFSHADSKVRSKVVDLLGSSGNEISCSIAASALKDESKMNRIKGLRLLEKQGDPRCLRLIYDHVRKKEFDKSDTDERRQFYLTLAHMGGSKLTTFFVDQLGHGALAISERDIDRSIASIWALCAIGDDQGRSAVEAQLARKLISKEIKRTGAEALKRWGGKKNG